MIGRSNYFGICFSASHLKTALSFGASAKSRTAKATLQNVAISFMSKIIVLHVKHVEFSFVALGSIVESCDKAPRPCCAK